MTKTAYDPPESCFNAPHVRGGRNRASYVLDAEPRSPLTSTYSWRWDYHGFSKSMLPN